MKKILIAALAVLSLTVGSVAYAAEPIQGTVVAINQVEADVQKTVRVYGNGYLIGTGFFIKGGYIITAEHSFRIHKPTTLSYEDGSGAYGTAELVKLDPTLDLAILKTDTYKEHPYFELAEYPDLTELTIIGNPQKAYFEKRTGKITSFHKWITISSPDTLLSATYRMTSTAYSTPGFSGGPAIQNGKVIGVAVGGPKPGATDELSILVKLDDLKSFIEGAIGDESKRVAGISETTAIID